MNTKKRTLILMGAMAFLAVSLYSAEKPRSDKLFAFDLRLVGMKG
jgi:hypothetical protein